MTNDEAKSVLFDMLGKGIFVEDTKENQAILAALRALEREPFTDAIIRQAAIVQLSHNKTGDDDCDVIIQKDIETIKALTPVTPQSKTGQWILSSGYWRCSECKEKALLKLDKAKGGCREYIPIKSNYCPNCGAKMEVEE